jgi:SAM-dependent methyltransferase
MPGLEDGEGDRNDRLSAEYFDVMAEVARDHWWYRNRRLWLAQLLEGRVRHGGRALDVGCGTGETLAALAQAGFADPVGTDLSPYVLAYARDRSPHATLRSLAEELPFSSGSVACLTSMDVLEHVADDRAALREYHRVVEPGGVAVLMVPAYQWLFSDHDRRACHHRRYSARALAERTEEAGFVVERAGYFHSFLVPPAALLRRTPLHRLQRGTDEEASDGSALVGRVCGALAAAERRLARRRGVPAGLSVALVARRPAATP